MHMCILDINKKKQIFTQLPFDFEKSNDLQQHLGRLSNKLPVVQIQSNEFIAIKSQQLTRFTITKDLKCVIINTLPHGHSFGRAFADHCCVVPINNKWLVSFESSKIS